MLEVLKGLMAIETKAYNDMYLLTICWLIPSAVVVGAPAATPYARYKMADILTSVLPDRTVAFVTQGLQ
jgi:hypothetical protein